MLSKRPIRSQATLQYAVVLTSMGREREIGRARERQREREFSEGGSVFAQSEFVAFIMLQPAHVHAPLAGG